MKLEDMTNIQVMDTIADEDYKEAYEEILSRFAEKDKQIAHLEKALELMAEDMRGLIRRYNAPFQADKNVQQLIKHFMEQAKCSTK